MTLGYIILSVAVLVLRSDDLAEIFSMIFKDAFSLKAGTFGIGGFFLSKSVRFGTMRGLVSNEAGCGTAPTAHAVSDCKEPARQGVFGIFEVFVDTIVLCTLTALVVIISYGNV
jgi:AGCS family alanine or glycine:cation symporter